VNVYLMQHARPVPEEENPSRPLSHQGEGDAARVGAFLRNARIAITNVFHSGKLRARQTAEIVSAEMKISRMPKEKAGLRPMDDVRSIAAEVEKHGKDLLIVGHLPHLARLTSFLVTGSETTPLVQFQQGGVVCLCHSEEENGWRVAWMVVPELLPV